MIDAAKLRRVLIALWVLSIALSAYLLPRHPVIAGVILATALAGAAWRWQATRLMRQVSAAATRCDLDALKRLSLSTHPLSQYARLVYIHHGGRDLSGLLLCTCGKCEKDWIDQEFELLARRVKLAWEGQGPVLSSSYEALSAGMRGCPPYWQSMAIEWRLITALISQALANEASPPGVDLEGTVKGERWTVLKWPARLALAIGANARGDHAEARRLLEGMPEWKEGTPLERARRELFSSLEAGRGWTPMNGSASAPRP